MSTEIENQVVQVTFDNKEFERNIAATMESLEDFKDELEFKDASKNFAELEKASESVDFEKLNDTIDKIGDHFTIMGRLAFKVTDDIATYLETKLKGAINAVQKVSTDIISPKAGLSKYDDYTHGVKAIMAALSEEEKEKILAENDDLLTGVENKLGELMAYTDETSYNFTEMVNTIGKFLGNGVSFNDSLAAMQGIANWAALAGQNSQTATQAMYQMSQALGAGFVKYQDWKEMATTKNMGTIQAKDTFINAAMELGYIQQEDINQAKKAVVAAGGLEKNWRNWFFESDQLTKQQWFKTEVLVKGLNEFSSVSNNVIGMLGELSDDSNLTMTRFLRSADKVKKGTQTVDEAVAELANRWNLTDEDIKKVTESMKFATAAENEMAYNAIKNAQAAVSMNEAIDATKDAAGTAWLTIFEALIGNLEEASTLWTDFSNDLYTIFVDPLYDISDALTDWGKKTIKFIDKEGEEVEDTMRAFMWDSIAQLGQAFSSVFKTLFGWFNSNQGIPGIGDVVVNVLNKIISGINKLSDIFRSIAASSTIVQLGFLLSDLVDIFKNLYSIVKKLISGVLDGLFSSVKVGYYEVNKLDTILSSGLYILRRFTTILVNLTNAISSSKGFNFVVSLATKIISRFMTKLNNTMHILSGIARILTGDVIGGLYEIEQVIKTLVKKFTEFFGLDSEKWAKRIEKAFNKVQKWFDKLSEKTAEVTDYISDLFANTEQTFSGYASTILKIIGGALLKAVEAIADFFGIDLSKYEAELLKKFEKFGDKLTKYFEKLRERFGKLFEAIGEDFTEGLPKRWKEFIDEFSSSESGAGKIEAVLDFIGDAIRHGAERILDAVAILFGVDTEKVKDFVLGFIDKIAEGANKLKPGFEKVWDTIGKIFDTIVEIFTKIGNTIIQIAKDATGNQDFGWEDVLDKIIDLITNLVSFAIWIGTGIANIIIEAGPWLIKIGEMIKFAVVELWKALSFVIGIDKSKEAEAAFKNIKGILIAVAGVIMLIMAINLFKNINWLISSLQGISEKVEKKLKGNVLSNIARMLKGIALILLALAIVANQDTRGIAQATIVLAVIFFLLNKSIKVIVNSLIDLSSFLNKSRSSLKIESFNAASVAIMSILSILTKMVGRLVLSIAFLSIVNKLAGSNNVYDAMVTLAALLSIIILGTKSIIRASGKLDKNSAKALENVDDIIKGLTKSLIKLSARVFAMAFIVGKLMDSKNGATSLLASIGVMIVSLGIIGVGTELVIKVGKEIKKADKIDPIVTAMYKLSKTFALMALAISALGFILQKLLGSGNGGGSGENNKWVLTLTISFGVLIAGMLILVACSSLISKISKRFDAAGIQASADTLWSALKSIASLVLAVDAMITSVATVFALIVLFSLLINLVNIWDVLTSFGLTILIFVAVAALAEVLGKIDLKDNTKQLGWLALAMIELAGTVLILTAALVLLSIAYDGGGALGLTLLTIVVVGLAVILGLISKYFDFQQIKEFSEGVMLITASVLLLALALTLMSNFAGDELWNAVGALTVMMVVLLAFTAVLSLVSAGAQAMKAIAIAILLFEAGILILAGLGYIADWMIEGINKLRAGVYELVDALVQLLIDILCALAESLQEHASGLANAIFALLNAAITVAGELLRGLFQFIFEFIFGRFPELGLNILQGIWQGIQNGFNWIKQKIKEFIQWFIGIFTDGWDINSPSKVFADIGINLIKGLWEGIKDMGKWIKDKIKGFCKGVIDGFCGFFGINSPSKVMAGLGDFLVQGLGVGIEGAKDGAIGAIKNLGSDLIGNFLPEGGLLGALGLGDLKNALTGNLGLDGLTDSFNMDNLLGDLNMDSMMNGMNIGSITGDLNMPAFDASSLGLSSTYGMNIVPSMGGVGGLDIPTNYQPTVDDAQINQITSSYEDRSEDVINAINNLRETVAGQSEAISKFQMVLDTGVIVGELVNPLDKALGNKTRLASSRGV